MASSHPYPHGLPPKRETNIRLPSIASLNLLSYPSPSPTQTPTPTASPTRASFEQTQQWPGVHSLGHVQRECSGYRSYSLPDINRFPTTAPRSLSVPDIRYWSANSVGPCRTTPRCNSRQKPYATKKTSKKGKRGQRAPSGNAPVARSNAKYTDEQNHFIIYHHDDLEWSWKDTKKAYMRRWPKQGKEQPERTGGALQCAFYRTNALIPALEPGNDTLILAPPQDFNQGKPTKTGDDSTQSEISRDSYELYQVQGGVPHLLEEVKVRATDVARKLCLRYPEAMLKYDWVRPEDKVKAQMIAAKRRVQRQEWRQRFGCQMYKDGSYLHKWRSMPYVSLSPFQTQPTFCPVTRLTFKPPYKR
ncbi:hypothetical protein QBC43DRAFT_307137 [Cladorrhinum sp. PSN259]|nr:hypothetical protein QBC43DRAFT_307137 [Cladorrhinum sp. PSN259]